MREELKIQQSETSMTSSPIVKDLNAWKPGYDLETPVVKLQ